MNRSSSSSFSSPGRLRIIKSGRCLRPGPFAVPTRNPMSDQPKLVLGLADVPVAESAVSFIDGKRARLEYRGVAVEQLARESTFEETAWLLLEGVLPSQRGPARLRAELRSHRRLKYKIIDVLKCLPETGHPM